MPNARVRQVVDMRKAVPAQEDKAAAKDKAQAVLDKLKTAAELIAQHIDETLTYYDFPPS